MSSVSHELKFCIMCILILVLKLLHKQTMWMFKWSCCLTVRKRGNMAKMLLAAAKEFIFNFYVLGFVKRVSVPYANLYSKLVTYLRQLQSKEAGFEFGSKYWHELLCKVELSLVIQPRSGASYNDWVCNNFMKVQKHSLKVQPTRCNFSQFIYFCKTFYVFQTVFSFRHQELKIAHTASGICQTVTATCCWPGRPG